MINFLAEDAHYRVYALYESVYLKTKVHSKKPAGFEEADSVVAVHYGNPISAIILGDYIIVAGCGLTIFDTITKIETVLFYESDNIKWTNGLHRDDTDEFLEFRYVGYNEADQMRVFKMNVLTKEVIMLP